MQRETEHNRAYDITVEEVTKLWSKLFGADDRLSRENVDSVVRIIDRYLSEEANLCRLQSEKQTIHPRHLPPGKRRALIDEVFGILEDARNK